MPNTALHRRAFLSVLAAAGGSGLVASRLEAAHATVASALHRLESEVTHGRDWRRLRREEYLLDPDLLYLNHASIGTVPRAVHEAHAGYARLCETNPWLYMWGGAWEEPREEVRSLVARRLGCDPSSLALTHNTTEGFNVLAQGLPLGPGDEVLWSSLNHAGASICFQEQARRRGFSVRSFSFPLDRVEETRGEDVVDRYLDEISPETRLLVLPHVDNMVGLRVPLRELAVGARARGVEWIAVDGAQSVGMIPVELDGLGVDAYAGSPHKWLQAPKGLGILYLSASIRGDLEPMWTTWGQERWAGSARRFEDYGTRNLPELLALSDAVAFQDAMGEGPRGERLQAIHAAMMEGVDARPGLRWRSPRRWSDGASLVAVEVVGAAAPAVARRLWDEAGLVVRAFGGELNAVRLSPNVHTLDDEVERTLDLLSGAAP